MKYLIMVAVMGLLGFAMFAGYTNSWLMFWISFPLSALFGIVLVGVYAIEDVQRNKTHQRDQEN